MSFKGINDINNIKLQTERINTNIEYAKERFGIKILTLEEIKQLPLTPQNVELIAKNTKRLNDIISGEYIERRNEQYLDNYRKMLEHAHVSENTLKRFDNVMTKLKSPMYVADMLPPMKDYYPKLKYGKDESGEQIDVKVEIDEMENKVNESLEDLTRIYGIK